jgi:hypothetical protein
MPRVCGGACDAPDCPALEEGCNQSAPQLAPHIQGLRIPPKNKIASAAVISTRSIRSLSRMKSTTETKNSASRGIRVTLVIVIIKSTLRSHSAACSQEHSSRGPVTGGRRFVTLVSFRRA